jgi:hypothetical protein
MTLQSSLAAGPKMFGSRLCENYFKIFVGGTPLKNGIIIH